MENKMDETATPHGGSPIGQEDDVERPFYVRQCGGLHTIDQRRDWLNEAFLAASKEANAPPPLWWRSSISDVVPGLVLLEVWKTRPKDEGEPRWALTTSIADR
jgi:hypothetical protein